MPRIFGKAALAWALALAVGSADAAQPAAAPSIGVFYFPGWKDNTIGSPAPLPWQRIKAYPEREPLLGWYDEGQPAVMAEQLRWMKSAGLDFVVFDYYWAERPVMSHAVDNFKASEAKAGLHYAVMWANHDDRPRSHAEFTGMANDLVKNHLGRADYLRVDGKPILYIMVPGGLQAKAARFGSSAAELLRELRSLARSAGVPELLIAGGAGGGRWETTIKARQWGFDAFFAYNYHAGVDGRTLGELRDSRSYAELDNNYRSHWDWFMTKAELPYVLPMTSGWDKRPWGGSEDKLHDQSLSTPAEFKAHLKAARYVLLANPAKTLGLGVICCWNEFGEGSFIEPTKAQGTVYLDTVKSVFGP